MAGRRGKNKNEYYFDYTLLFIILFLVGFGLVMIYSASSYSAETEMGNAMYFLIHQGGAAALGLVAMFVVSRIPYHFWERFAVLGYAASIVMILLVLSPLGIERNGARRWLNLGISVQPAEIAKLAMILFLASMICKMGRNVRSGKAFFMILGAAAVVCGLVWQITDNMSSAIIIFGIAFLMLFVASPDYKRFILIGAAGLTGAALLVFLISKASTTEGMNFRSIRILAWLNPELYASGTGFQTLQALYAIGSGGIFGKGLGQSIQKLGYLPEEQNDMI